MDPVRVVMLGVLLGSSGSRTGVAREFLKSHSMGVNQTPESYSPLPGQNVLPGSPHTQIQ